MLLTPDASNVALTNNIADEVERNSEVLVNISLVDEKLNETGADIIFNTYSKDVPMNDNAEETIIWQEKKITMSQYHLMVRCVLFAVRERRERILVVLVPNQYMFYVGSLWVKKVMEHMFCAVIVKMTNLFNERE